MEWNRIKAEFIGIWEIFREISTASGVQLGELH